MTGLPADVTVEELIEAFQNFGDLADVFIPKDAESKIPLGFVFIRFQSENILLFGLFFWGGGGLRTGIGLKFLCKNFFC